jgi:hypothetical protein
MRTPSRLLTVLALVVILGGCVLKNDIPAGLKVARTFFSGAATKVEAEAMYGTSRIAQPGALDDALRAFKAASDDASITILRPGAITIAAELEAQLARQTDDVVVLIGHRNAAGQLVMADASLVELSGIGGRTAGARVVVISCESKIFCSGPLAAGLGDSITTDLAMSTYRLLPKYLQALPANPSATHLQIAVEAAFARATSDASFKSGTLKVTAIAGLGITAAGIAIRIDAG